jgi:arylformamidase
VTNADPYDASTTVPDVTVFFARWRAWSDAVRDTMPVVRDLRYGASEAETLDLVVPRPGTPLVVFFHGGYWRRLHKDDATYVARGLAPHGVASAIVNYALSPAASLEEIVRQARAALAWLRAHAAEYGVDTSRIVVAGHSAGGHLAAMCAVDAPITALVTLSGLHDLRPLAHSFVNAWLQLDETRAAALSPALLAPVAPTTVLAADGVREHDVFHTQARDLVAAWERHGCATAYEQTDDDHFTIVSRLHDPADPLTSRIAALALG